MTDVRLHFHDDGFAIETSQDVSDIIEANKTDQNTPQKSDWGRHVARIPNVILTQWLNEEWQRGNISIRAFSTEMDELVQRKLQDPEWKWLRTDSQQVQGWLGFGS